MHTSGDSQSSTLARELQLLKFTKQSLHTQVSEILDGNFQQYLKKHLTNDISLHVTNNSTKEFNAVLEVKNGEEQLDFLIIGVTSLYAFIQLNWTGPRELKSPDKESYLDKIQLCDKRACEMLTVDSIEFSTEPRQPKLLLLARFLLSANYTKLSTALWWQLRVLHIHQSLLDENSSLLYARIEMLASQLTLSPLLTRPELQLEFNLEMVHVYMTYGVISKSQHRMREVRRLSEMSLELKGALGKRTKWQQKNIAQLLLDISFNDTKSVESSPDMTNQETDTSANTSNENLTNTPDENPANISNENSVNTSNKNSAHTFNANSANTPNENSANNTSNVNSAKTPKENSANVPKENSTNTSNENSANAPKNNSANVPKENSANTPNESSQSEEPAQSTASTASQSNNTTTTGASSNTTKQNLPHNVNLDDDTRLETIAYEADTKVPELTGSQQAVVYTSLVHKHRCQPQDELRHEELRPYIDVLLAQESLLWSVRYGTLYLRSKLEADHRRTVERSLMQLEELRASLTKEEPSCRVRLEEFFMSWIPSASTMETTLARVLASLGDIKSALVIHESLRHWEEMIACYNLLQLRHLSEKIIREQLALGETPKLYCLLGDATDEVEHYHTAWKLSEERSARAMKSLGLYYFKRKEYATAIPYFQKSLEVNSIQVGLWSRLGFAALQCEDKMDVACSAYNRYVSLEPDDFQGWNNLARAHLDKGHKLRAYHALVEAVRTSNMDNWKVIENLMRVALDVGHFECALRNYSHLLDIKPKHVDTQVLSILVHAILSNLRDAGLRNSARTLLSNALRLFGRLTSAILNDSELWWLYAQLNAVRDDAGCVTELRKTLKFLTQAHAIRMRDERSVRDAHGRVRLGEICSMLSDVTGDLARVKPALTDRKQVLVTCKMALRSTLVTMEREGGEGEEVERVRESLQRVESLLAE